ncbi:hypothetical protein EDD21DRAFT_106805 [Dissophora ornata]|nr:hypothetical protein EDD21DRAFT_106805 [Dissophora ornata]
MEFGYETRTRNFSFLPIMIVKFHLQEEPAAVYSFDAPSTHTNVIHIRKSIALLLNILPSNLVLSFRGLEVSSTVYKCNTKWEYSEMVGLLTFITWCLFHFLSNRCKTQTPFVPITSPTPTP